MPLCVVAFYFESVLGITSRDVEEEEDEKRGEVEEEWAHALLLGFLLANGLLLGRRGGDVLFLYPNCFDFSFMHKDGRED